MEPNQTDNPQAFLNEVADAMESAASQIDESSAVQTMGLVTTNSHVGKAKFAPRLVYSTCYSLSFGVCFTTFLVCRYVPKNNSLVQGIISGGAAATNDVDAWLARRQEASQHKRFQTDADLVDEGSMALAPA